MLCLLRTYQMHAAGANGQDVYSTASVQYAVHTLRFYFYIRCACVVLRMMSVCRILPRRVQRSGSRAAYVQFLTLR